MPRIMDISITNWKRTHGDDDERRGAAAVTAKLRERGRQMEANGLVKVERRAAEAARKRAQRLALTDEARRLARVKDAARKRAVRAAHKVAADGR